MKIVAAVFYFKDGTILYVKADTGIYNNKTLDMKFEQNVKANYINSELFANKAEYSIFLIIERIKSGENSVSSYTSFFGLIFNGNPMISWIFIDFQ